MQLFLLNFLLLFLINIGLQAQEFKSIETSVNSSFRGLCIVNEHLAFVSGSKGYLGRSTDAGNSWKFEQLQGFENSDFRTLHAHSEQQIILANAGSPAFVLFTENSGKTWDTVYFNAHADAFIDGIAFWNKKEGIIYGDPINGRMFILTTKDGGKSWQELPEAKRPELKAGEASFAASGTTIRTIGNKVFIATGGKVSRIWIAEKGKYDWKALSTPILQGESSQGIFSIALLNEKNFVITGGDYAVDTLKSNHVFITANGGNNFSAPEKPTGGYRSCVGYINSKTLIATGTSGTDISFDGGKTWQELLKERFHVLKSHKKENLILFAGAGGKIGKLTLKETKKRVKN
jgi:photosystem II stability/assembly factor-like uncharacterized protein